MHLMLNAVACLPTHLSLLASCPSPVYGEQDHVVELIFDFDDNFSTPQPRIQHGLASERIEWISRIKQHNLESLLILAILKWPFRSNYNGSLHSMGNLCKMFHAIDFR